MIALPYGATVGNIVTCVHIADYGYFQALFEWMLRIPLTGFTGVRPGTPRKAESPKRLRI